MPTSIDLQQKSLHEVLNASVEQYAHRTAINFLGQTTSFASFGEQSDQVAAGLTEQGIEPGDRVALYCINSDLFVVTYLGVVKAGAVVVAINLLLTPGEIEYILNDSGAKAIIYHEVFANSVSKFRQNTASLQYYFYIGEHPSETADRKFNTLLSCAKPPPILTCDTEQDVVSIIYTSGTTGRPKGVMLTHRNLVSNTASVQTAMTIRPGEDVILVVLPMFHSFASTVGMLTPLLYGCTLLPVPKFDINLVMDTIATGKASIFLGVPSMYNMLLSSTDEQVDKFSSIRFCISGGAAMPQAIMNKFEARFGKMIYEGDGPSECSPVTCVNPIGGLRKPASVGLPIPDVAIQIMDQDGKVVADNNIGEICVRGPNVMKGYWNRPAETEQVFFGEWLRTGDLGHKDEQGYFYIDDRLKDMIIVNGMNVYPQAVEDVLYQFSPVHEVAIVGEPDELRGEIPVAYVVLKPDESCTLEDIVDFCQPLLGRHQLPRKAVFMAQLPKNATGKILKRELRKQGELERGIDSRESDSASR